MTFDNYIDYHEYTIVGHELVHAGSHARLQAVDRGMPSQGISTEWCYLYLIKCYEPTVGYPPPFRSLIILVMSTVTGQKASKINIYLNTNKIMWMRWLVDFCSSYHLEPIAKGVVPPRAYSQGWHYHRSWGLGPAGGMHPPSFFEL